MNFIAPFLVAVIALWSTPEAEGAWWDPFTSGHSSCSHPGYFQNSHDCSKFYRCVDQSTDELNLLVRYDFDCPPYTVFDQSVSVCVAPGDSGCASGWSSEGGGGWDQVKRIENEGWGWSPPTKKSGWSAPAPAPKVPSKGWSASSNQFWSFTPGNSYVVIYDHRGKKRTIKYDPTEDEY